MRYVTPCENTGLRKVRGVDHKCTVYVMQKGTAFKIDDERREYPVVPIKGEMEYTFTLRWIDGRSVAVFRDEKGAEFAQPVIDDPRAKREEAKRRRAQKIKDTLALDTGDAEDDEPDRLAETRDAPRRAKRPPKARKPLVLEPL